jgi:DNA-binding NarL/FixJ family response regulator
LDSEANTKPPTPATIFVHFCVDGLTVTEIARRCRCSRGTVLNRLALLRKRTGVAPEHLRTLSGHFARIENTIADPRASHIHRAHLTDDIDESYHG